MKRTYAADTTVSVARSMSEITDLLRAWGCQEVRWSENWSTREVQLRFVWVHEGAQLTARFAVRVAADEVLLKDLPDKHRYNQEGRASWLNREREQRARSSMRVVLIKLKADFSMVEAGICSAAEVLLPFMENTRGHTIAELVVPKLLEVARGDDGALQLEGPT